MNFFIQNLNLLVKNFGFSISSIDLQMILPIGISFYTFQTLSYTVDVYRGKIQSEKDVLTFLCYVSFFPQLVAGPIERAKNMLPQFKQNRYFSEENSIMGIKRIIWGLFIKVNVAATLGEFVTTMHANSGDYSAVYLFLGALFFVVQLYCDFSGYSHIAIGLGLLFGFKLSENFNYPLSNITNPVEFFRRWHITLTDWFKDYVGVPLRKQLQNSIWIRIIPLLILSLIGLWHGPKWTFIIAFASIAIYSIFHKVSLKFTGIKRIIVILVYNLLIALHLIFFRAESFQTAVTYLSNMVVWNIPVDNYDFIKPLFVYIVFLSSELWASKKGYVFQLQRMTTSKAINYLLLALLTLIITGSIETSNEFIYFEF